ncbi:cupin domain-containing protein [Asticcacaulis sp. AC402]|uniref:cupin domain-containing protein n=1 Tax=Asticcacaulis sp. AC402 TaxID=1282361 RepID=UPI0003C3E7D0|nr:cupin domain-containing protein [Asticcacaulis sp. AC402]ESQ73880.1 hypothetical protein ABAC402_17175 [Asticcacaulis sp. AC402]
MTMATVKTGPHTLGKAFAHLLDDSGIMAVPVDDEFWTKGVAELPPGRLVSVFDNEADWTSWEMHPNGDELILVLSGRLVLILETANTRWNEMVQAGQFFIVPKGVWHTADVPEPGRALFVTPGEGTEHRERSIG